MKAYSQPTQKSRLKQRLSVLIRRGRALLDLSVHVRGDYPKGTFGQLAIDET